MLKPITRSRPTASSYTQFAVLVHWFVAAALLADTVLGWWMLGVPKQPVGVRAGWFNLHKSVGLTIALLVVLRLAWRLQHPVAATALPRWQQLASRTVHVLLYACMFALPLSGLLGSNFTRYPVLFFGARLPGWNHDWPAAKELMSTLHEGTAWLLVVLVAIHVTAALWHWLRGDAAASRMGMPARRRARTFSGSSTR